MPQHRLNEEERDYFVSEIAHADEALSKVCSDLEVLLQALSFATQYDLTEELRFGLEQLKQIRSNDKH